MLRPGGTVGFIWNMREDSAPWAAALNRLLAAEARDQQGDLPEGNRAVVDAFAAELDAEVTTRTARWVQRVPPEAVVGRVASSSRIALLDEAGRARPTSVRCASSSPAIPTPGAGTRSTWPT